MAMIILDGCHHTGKTTMVEATCTGLIQPKCLRPEDTERCLVDWIESWGKSEDIAVFDHFILFGYPVKSADPENEERFRREYFIRDATLMWAAECLHDAQAEGYVLIIHANPPLWVTPEQERARDKFLEVFEGWDAWHYDYTDAANVEATKALIRDFIKAHSKVPA